MHEGHIQEYLIYLHVKYLHLWIIKFLIIFNKNTRSLENPMANPLTGFILGNSLIKAPVHREVKLGD